jgi:hypothetical protein
MKKYFLFTLLTLLGAYACQPPQEEVTQAESEETPLLEISPQSEAYATALETYMKALLVADSAQLATVLTPDFMNVRMSVTPDTSDMSKILEGWRAYLDERSDQSIETVAISALQVNDGEFKGDWVQYWGTYSCTVNSTGTQMDLPFFSNNLMENGKMKISYVYFDRLDWVMKDGYTLVPPSQE